MEPLARASGFIVSQEKSTLVQDPVCGLKIDAKDAFASRESMGQTFYFGSQACVAKFEANPHAYMHHEARPLASPLAVMIDTGWWYVVWTVVVLIMPAIILLFGARHKAKQPCASTEIHE